MERTPVPSMQLQEMVNDEHYKSEATKEDTSTIVHPTPIADSELISFAENDAEDPKNWPARRKLIVTLLVSAVGFITPATSSMVAPALEDIAKDLHITKPIESQLVLSIFVLGLGVGPILLGPLSETYGRAPVLRVGNFFYLIFNTAGGLAQTKNGMLAFRFLAGVGGSAPLVVSFSLSTPYSIDLIKGF
jgi:predicted MFS family arabinose efflux permease